MDPDVLVAQVHESGNARASLRPYRGQDGLCSAFIKRILAFYMEDAAEVGKLARHWQAFRDYGDDPALAYRAKGIYDRLNGKWLLSAKAFQTAGELATTQVDQYSFAVGAIDSYGRAGQIDAAKSLGIQIAEGLDKLDRSDLAGRARLNTGNALLWAERGPEAREFYARAIPALQAGGFVSEEASARLGLSTTHLYGGDPKVAFSEAQAAKSIAEEHGMDYLSTLCQVNLAHSDLLEGRADEAYAKLLKLRGELEDSPAELARAYEFVGDACLRLNLFTEAIDSYKVALQHSAALTQTDRAHVIFGLGEAERDPVVADRYLALAAKRYGEIGNRAWQAGAISARIGLRPSRRDALKLSDVALTASGDSPYHRTAALLARAKAMSVRGQKPRAELIASQKLVDRYGYRQFAWRVHALKAETSKHPAPHFRRMFAEMMRDRLATSSVAARMGFLEDKSEAMGAYLSYLLSNPTPAKVAEAREAIRRTRAATLFDEIFRSGSLQLDPARVKRLEDLRQNVVRDAAESASDSRSTSATAPSRTGWTEASHVVGALDQAIPSSIAENCVVFTEAQGKLWAILEDKAIKLPIDRDQLLDSLKWLRFELLAPAAFKDAPSHEANLIIKGLRERLVEPWFSHQAKGFRICPDGPLWHLPWDAVIGEGATLSLHPSFVGGGAVGKVSRVAVWVNAAADLPNASREERLLLDRFPEAKVFRTRQELLGSLTQAWDLVHVICHAKHNQENPMFSCLEFPDGPVYAGEIARSGLKTRLACLSACETGALSLAGHSEPDGLVRAFLARGAQAAIASLWPLDDEAASRFFQRLYNGFGPQQDLAQAVAQAREDVRAWREHPYFWASIALFGGYQ